MERKEFVTLIGLTAGSLLFASCLEGCKKKPVNVPVDFTLDLSQTANAALKHAGGYVISNEVIVAKTNTGIYLAVAVACTHQGGYIQYIATTNTFYCPNHGSIFDATGAVQRGPATIPLQQYKTQLTGTLLRVYS